MKNFWRIGKILGIIVAALTVPVIIGIVIIKLKESRKIRQERQNLPPIPPEEVNIPI
jgi:hypothetical protein